MLDWSRDVSMQASLNATLECAKAFSSTDSAPDLRVVQRADADHPRHRGQDRSDRHLCAASGGGISGSTLIEYDGAPHGLLASHKDRLIADVLQFVPQLALGLTRGAAEKVAADRQRRQRRLHGHRRRRGVRGRG